MARKIEIVERKIYTCSLCVETFDLRRDAEKHIKIPVVESLPLGLLYFHDDPLSVFVVSGEGEVNKNHTYTHRINCRYRNGEELFSSSGLTSSDIFRDRVVNGEANIYDEEGFEKARARIERFIDINPVRTNKTIDGWLKETVSSLK